MDVVNVRIVKSRPGNWYADLGDGVFEVYRRGDGYILKEDYDRGTEIAIWRCIGKGDCIEIEDWDADVEGVEDDARLVERIISQQLAVLRLYISEHGQATGCVSWEMAEAAVKLIEESVAGLVKREGASDCAFLRKFGDEQIHGEAARRRWVFDESRGQGERMDNEHK